MAFQRAEKTSFIHLTHYDFNSIQIFTIALSISRHFPNVIKGLYVAGEKKKKYISCSPLPFTSSLGKLKCGDNFRETLLLPSKSHVSQKRSHSLLSFPLFCIAERCMTHLLHYGMALTFTPPLQYKFSYIMET